MLSEYTLFKANPNIKFKCNTLSTLNHSDTVRYFNVNPQPLPLKTTS